MHRQHQILHTIETRGAAAGAETGSDILIPVRRSHDHVYSTPTPSSALITTNSLYIFVVFMTSLFHQEICSFFFYVCLVLDSTPTHTPFPLRCVLLDLHDLYTRSGEEVSRNCRVSLSDICVHTHAPPPEKIRRNCGVLYMPECSLRNIPIIHIRNTHLFCKARIEFL